jgi:hypothetical protein
MATDTQMPRPVFAKPAMPSAIPSAVPSAVPSAAPSAAPVTDADTARSKENIAQWKTYLPEDCAKTMIEMGWDVTT